MKKYKFLAFQVFCLVFYFLTKKIFDWGDGTSVVLQSCLYVGIIFEVLEITFGWKKRVNLLELKIFAICAVVGGGVWIWTKSLWAFSLWIISLMFLIKYKFESRKEIK